MSEIEGVSNFQPMVSPYSVEQVRIPMIGDRVKRIGEGQCGIVRETNCLGDGDGTVLVWWGTTTQSEGRDGIEILRWEPLLSLEPFGEPIVSADEIAARQEAQLKARYQ